MDWNYVIKIAVWTVGVTSMLKQLCAFIKVSWAKVLLTVIVGLIGMLCLHYLPEQVFLGLIGIAIAVIFYDNILKMIERMLKGSEQ